MSKHKICYIIYIIQFHCIKKILTFYFEVIVDTCVLVERMPEKKENSRKTSTSALLIMPEPLTMWITTNCGKLHAS